MAMNCAEIDELAGAFALGALPPDEAADVAAHLYTCARGHAELADLEATAALLPLLCAPVEPPASLRFRILADALADDERGQRALTRAVQEARAPVPIERARRGAWQAPAVWATAAVLAVAVGLGAWNVALHNQLNSRYTSGRNAALADVLQQGRFLPMTSAQGVQASVVVMPDDHAYVSGALPAAPAGKVYEAWVIRNGAPVPAGIVAGSNHALLQLTAPMAGAQSVALTIEPAGGSPQPTLPVVATASLT